MATRRSRLALSLLLLGALALSACSEEGPVVRVGTKSFTESYILGEIVADIIEKTGEVDVERTFGLGGTAVVYRAILSGDVDVYPEHYRLACRGAKIVLGRDWRDDCTWYFSNRTWFTLGCGGFLLTNYAPDLEAIFLKLTGGEGFREVDEMAS